MTRSLAARLPDARLAALVEGAFVREVLMGAQDNLTNVAAVVLGVAIGSGSPQMVALAGLSAATAEAISMAGVLYTATQAEQALDARDGGRPRDGRPRIGPAAAGAVTGVAAMVAGIVPLAPFAVLPLQAAVVVSLAISLAALFGLGVLTATVTARRAWINGLRLVLIGSAAAVMASLVGAVLRA